MSGVANVSRPPSVHAPWRKSVIIPLFFFQLAIALLVSIWGIFLGALSVYSGPDSGATDYDERLFFAYGFIGLISVPIIIWHIVSFSLFRLTAQTFLFGNIVISVISIVLIVLGVLVYLAPAAWKGADRDFFPITYAGGNCFMSTWVMVYSLLVWRRVNSGRALDMARPRRGLNAGGKGLDAQGDAIPMV